MPSAFYGMEIAKSGLFMAQKQLNVTGHNISNANTAGYTRQRIIQQNIDSNWGPNFIGQRKEMALIGQGVRLDELDQIRSPYLDMKYRETNPIANKWGVRATELHYVSLKFDPATQTNLLARYNDLKDAVQKFSTETEIDAEIRTNLRDQAISFCETLSTMHAQLLATQSEQNDAIGVCVEEVNRIAQSIAALNKEIYRYELSEQKALDLRDHRNLLIDELSNLTDIGYSYDDDDKLTITIGEEVLVTHDESFGIEIDPEGWEDPITGQTLSTIIWSDSGADVEIREGEIYGRLSIRDGVVDTEIGIPYIVEQLNIFARTLAMSFNEVHEAGWTPDDQVNGLPSQTGISFFDNPTGSYDDVTAGNLSLSQEILDNIYNIAASSIEVIRGSLPSSSMIGNQENARNLIDIVFEGDQGDLNGTTFEKFYQSLVTTIGVQTKHADDNHTVEYSVLGNTVEARASYSGVSIDEEMTNMIRFMHAYTAASRMITTMDEELDKLINGTGRVGL